MEKNILLIIVILMAAYLVINEAIGQKKYIANFTQAII